MPTRSRASGPFDLLELLDTLRDVELIVVGGVAGALHGTPRVTFDLDIVPDTRAPNVARLARALAALEARVREPGSRHLEVGHQLLSESAAAALGGQLRLRTRYGPLDVLWRLHDGRGFDALLPLSEILSDSERQIRVLSIQALIEIKEAAGRPHDLEDARYLRAILKRDA